MQLVDESGAVGLEQGVDVGENLRRRPLLNAEGTRQAYEQLVEVAAGAVALEDVELSVSVLDSFAAVWGALGNGERAACMLGASDHHRERSGMHRTQPDQVHLDRFVIPAKDSVASADWKRAYEAGKSMSIEAAVAEGLAAGSAVPSFAGAVGNR